MQLVTFCYRLESYLAVTSEADDVEFDRFSIALLVLRPDRPSLDREAEAELQDAHMAHLADLHDGGYLLAAGPLLG